MQEKQTSLLEINNFCIPNLSNIVKIQNVPNNRVNTENNKSTKHILIYINENTSFNNNNVHRIKERIL